MSTCCVSGCKNRHSSTTKLKFHRIPSGHRPFQVTRRGLWLKAIQQVNGGADELDGNVRICGAHLISGEASVDQNSPDFVPSVFTNTKPSPKKRANRSFGRRRRRCRKADAGEEEIKTPPRVDSPVDVHTLATSSVPKEEEAVTEEAEAETVTQKIHPETTSSSNQISRSFQVPAGIHKLDKMNPVVLLKTFIIPTGGYRCELCNLIFTSIPQLVTHSQLHGEQSFICEICGKQFRCQADFNEHQQDHIDEPSFPCNMCDRSFATSHNLKRHKLLHVKDGRKCSRCGVLFCRRHNHVLFLPQAGSVAKSGHDSSTVELRNVGSNLMPGPPEKCEQSQTDNLGGSAQGTMNVKPLLTTNVPTPPKPRPLSKTHKAPPPASHRRIYVPLLPKLSSVPSSPSSVTRSSEGPQKAQIPHLSSCRPLMPPDCAAPSIQPHPELPSSLKIFSPEYLTSALLEVKRNYEYILSKPSGVRKDVVKEEKDVVKEEKDVVKEEKDVVKEVKEEKDVGRGEKNVGKEERDIVNEEECNFPLSSPVERSVEQVKKQRTAYDLEIVI